MSIRHKTVSGFEQKFVCLDRGIYTFPNGYGQTPTNLTDKKHLENIINCIKKHDTKKLTDYLQYSTQCSPVLSYEGEAWSGFSNGKENNDVCSPATFEIRVQPFVEWLYNNNKAALQIIVTDILATKSEQLCQAFIEGLNGMHFLEPSPEIWKKKLEKVENEIKNLETYGRKLQEKKIEKGNAILELVESVNQKITQSKEANVDKENSLQAQLEILNFKLELSLELHSQDQELGVHRAPTRIISNILSILFSGGIANVLQKAITGKWLFFTRTASLDRVDNVDRALEICSTHQKFCG